MPSRNELDPRDASFLALAASHEDGLRGDPETAEQILGDIKGQFARSVYKVLTGIGRTRNPEVEKAVIALRKWAENCRTVHAPPKRTQNGSEPA